MLRWRRILQRLYISRYHYNIHITKNLIISPLVHRQFYSSTLGERVSKCITNVIDQIPTSSPSELTTTEINSIISHIPNLKSQLVSTVDPIRRLFILLMQDPVNVDPRLYLHFANGYLEFLDSQTKQLFIRRLLFHRMYETAWTFIDEFSSLNDIEEFVSICHDCIKGNIVMLVDLIISMPDYKFHNQIIESLAYNFNQDREQLKQVWQVCQRMNESEEEEVNDIFGNVSKNTLFDVLYLKIAIPNVDNPSNLLVKYPNVICIPGWLSSIFEPTTTFLTNNEDNRLKIVSSLVSRGIQLSELDIVQVINSQQLKPYQIFSLYKGNSKYIRERIMKEMIKRDKYNEFNIVFGKYLSYISSDLILQGLHIQKQKSFEDLVKSVNKLLKLDSEDILIQLFTSLQMTNEHFQKLFLKVKKRNKLARILINQYISSSTTNDFTPILPHITSKQTLLELFRRSTLTLEIDMNFLQLVFNKLIYITIPRDQFNKFQYILQKKLSYKARAEFHNMIRSLGQTLSLLDEQKLAIVLDHLITFTRNPSFIYFQDSNGVNYIIKSLINEILRFKLKSQNPTNLTTFVKQVLTKMTTPHKAYLMYWYFKLAVMNNPNMAFKLVDSGNQELQKYFPALVSGILNTNLDSNGKINLLVELISHARTKGFVQDFNKATAEELIDLINKSNPINADIMDRLSSLESETLNNVIKLRNKLKT